MYFAEATTVNLTRALFRKLALQFHPDRVGGDLETMKLINLAYEAKLASLDGEVSTGSDGKERTYRYNQKVEHEAMAKVLDLLGLSIENVVVEMIGTWVWVSGDTKPAKELLKEHGLRWHAKRTMWYWHVAGHRTRYNGHASINDLRSYYGSREFEREAAGGLVVA